MTETLLEPAPRVEGRHPARRRSAVLAAVVVVVAGLVAFLALRSVDHRYGPIEAGNFGGLYSQRNFVADADGSSYRLASAPGVSGQLMASVSNAGAHSVEITSIDTDDVVSGIRWSSYRMVPGGYVSGVSTPWRAFPATVPAHGVIRLLITIHHPANCSSYEPGTANYSGLHTVHWKSLLRSHSTVIDDGLEDIIIGIC